MENLDVRFEAQKAGVKLWQIADAMGISEPTLTRRMRHKLSDDERRMFLSVISSISKCSGEVIV